VKIRVIFEIQSKKELWKDFGEPDNCQNSFINNIYLGSQKFHFPKVNIRSVKRLNPKDKSKI